MDYKNYEIIEDDDSKIIEVFALLLAVAMMLSLVACGQKEPEQPEGNGHSDANNANGKMPINL